jgi:glycosyltransferase involved in cell wall biosynthesis
MSPASPWGTRFDCVVMLTWSNWKTEPRSNRYHYATRFARHVPVLFVQPDEASVAEEASGHPNVTIVHAGPRYGTEQSTIVRSVLETRTLSRPLLWVYNPNYEVLQAHLDGALRVFHATEDYFLVPEYETEPPGAQRYEHRRWRRNLQRRLVLELQSVDFVVCVTPGLARTCRRTCAYGGPLLVLENGCDYAFWAAGRSAPKRSGASNVVIYQGGINERLDTSLIAAVMNALPDWEFRFCGPVSASFSDWRLVERQPNFRYLGKLQPEALRDALYDADVGIMPYVQEPIIERQSLPLKAFEYAACGLPVVSVPIDAIAHQTDVFRFARSAKDFATAIIKESSTRDDPVRRTNRQNAARQQDYDRRFAELSEALTHLEIGERRPAWRARARASLLSLAVRWNAFCSWGAQVRRHRLGF